MPRMDMDAMARIPGNGFDSALNVALVRTIYRAVFLFVFLANMDDRTEALVQLFANTNS